EDGVRDLIVTGVQTCALPIFADAMDGPLANGTYRMTFDVGAYYKKKGSAPSFMQRFTLDFEITDARRSYHIPLLMSPYSCSVYQIGRASCRESVYVAVGAGRF